MGQDFQAWNCSRMSHRVWIVSGHHCGWCVSSNCRGQPWSSKGVFILLHSDWSITAAIQYTEFDLSFIKIIFGAFGLPFGLIMTLVTGGELFTGNTALVTAAAMEGKTTKADLIKNWVASYAGNFVGSLLLAYLAFKSGTLGNAPASK
jgi:formate/nitrite transporter FocA (FNT family)